MCEEFLGTEGLVTYLFDSFEIFGQFSLKLGEIGLYLFDEFIEEHLHDSEIIFELFHDFVADVIIHKQFVLLLGKGLAVYLTLLQPDVRLVCYHALPLRQHQDKDLGLVQGNTQLVHRETVVDLQGQVVQEHRLVSLKQEPVLYLTDRLLAPLCLFVLLGNRFVDVLLLRLVGVPGLHDRNLLFIVGVGHLHLLDDLLVLEVDRVHLGRHLQLVLCALLGQRHTAVYVVFILLLRLEEV